MKKIKIGFLPYQLYLILLASYIFLSLNHMIPNDLMGAIGVLMVFSLILEEIGRHIPLVRTLGGKVLVVTFLPSFLVYKKWLPNDSVQIINEFMDNTNFLMLFIVFIVVGSMISMSREVLIKSASKIIVALLTSQIMGIIVGCVVAVLLGFDLKHAFFFIVVPVMAGGVGEGALPLSIGYSAAFGLSQGDVFAQLLPCVFMGGLIGVVYAGLLNQLGLRRNDLTGFGVLVRDTTSNSLSGESKNEMPHKLEYTLSAATLAISIYFLSILLKKFIGLPVPIVVLLLVIAIKILNLVPKEIEVGSVDLYRFTVTAISPLLLFGVGVSMTPWEDLIKVFSDFRIVIVLFTVVTTIVIVGFFMGRLTGLNEIDSAIVMSCCSGQGGTGALAILAAGERMQLMPFAQVSVRIGGALVVMLALSLARLF
ncbi:2-hydroxycarboxylate transporter family protein [Lapidilactobacillus achengensis]|uniref:2-hydroxycarboxylate transporter family protein n=1 Tax=Lapidilactobacillus achengensis TaxID=2486000 RepID=A0ABW1URM4_9LACO|nr:2-hydroxycarboxylate transporter family protein [Lapidilactobacillus achengensis]